MPGRALARKFKIGLGTIQRAQQALKKLADPNGSVDSTPSTLDGAGKDKQQTPPEKKPKESKPPKPLRKIVLEIETSCGKLKEVFQDRDAQLQKNVSDRIDRFVEFLHTLR